VLAQLSQTSATSGLSPTVVVALIGVLVTIIGSVGTYLISNRTVSRSGARLLADLQILEKAKSLDVDSEVMQAIRQRVLTSARDHSRRRGLAAFSNRAG
jgi:hypothetical protein